MTNEFKPTPDQLNNADIKPMRTHYVGAEGMVIGIERLDTEEVKPQDMVPAKVLFEMAARQNEAVDEIFRQAMRKSILDLLPPEHQGTVIMAGLKGSTKVKGTLARLFLRVLHVHPRAEKDIRDKSAYVKARNKKRNSRKLRK